MYFSLIFFLILIVPVAVMPRQMLAGHRSPHRIVMQAIIASMAAILMVFMLASYLDDSVYSEGKAAAELLSQQAAANTQLADLMGLGDTSEEERLDFFSQVYDLGLDRIPVSFMFLAAVAAYLEYLLISSLLARRGRVKKMPPFREFSFPYGTAMAVMLMYLTTWLIASAETSYGAMLFANLDMLFDLVFALQGISVVLLFFHLKRIPAAAGIVVAAVMWITSIGKLFLVLLGLIDMMMGLKGRIRGRNAGRS